MYLEKTSSYDDGHGQHIRKAWYLVMMQLDIDPTAMYRCVIRKVALSQLGQFMSGYAHIGGQRVYLEGSLGSNGLPVRVSKAIFDIGVPLSVAAFNMYQIDHGHNTIEERTRSVLKGWAYENWDALLPEDLRFPKVTSWGMCTIKLLRIKRDLAVYEVTAIPDGATSWLNPGDRIQLWRPEKHGEGLKWGGKFETLEHHKALAEKGQ